MSLRSCFQVAASVALAVPCFSGVALAGAAGGGTDTAGIYRPEKAKFLLTNTNAPAGQSAPVWRSYQYNQLNRVPICGNWNAPTDNIDTVGVFRPDKAKWFLTDDDGGAGNPVPNNEFTFGNVPATDKVALACDWDGDDVDEVIVYRASKGKFNMAGDNVDGGGANAEIFFGPFDASYDPNDPFTIPFCADLCAEHTGDEIGVYRPDKAKYFVDCENNGGAASFTTIFNQVNRVPLAGNFDGQPGAGIGAYRADKAKWFLSNDPQMTAVDFEYFFAQADKIPLMCNTDGM